MGIGPRCGALSAYGPGSVRLTRLWAWECGYGLAYGPGLYGYGLSALVHMVHVPYRGIARMCLGPGLYGPGLWLGPGSALGPGHAGT